MRDERNTSKVDKHMGQHIWDQRDSSKLNGQLRTRRTLPDWRTNEGSLRGTRLDWDSLLEWRKHEVLEGHMNRPL